MCAVISPSAQLLQQLEILKSLGKEPLLASYTSEQGRQHVHVLTLLSFPKLVNNCGVCNVEYLNVLTSPTVVFS